MNYYKTKTTKRFTYKINRNDTAKQAGSNTVSISTNPVEGTGYSVGSNTFTMTVREAHALNSFLTSELISDGQSLS